MTSPRFTSEELSAATQGRWMGPPPPEAAGVSTDTRRIAPGVCFVALRGERFDGHDFVPAAAAAGAACAVVEEGWAGPGSIPRLAVPDTLAALGALARFHRRRFDLPVVAVTGSNGKTTTREMVAAILARRGPACRPNGPVLRSEGNLNNEVGVPLTLFRLEASHTAAVIEMGMNHPGEIARLARIAEPGVGLVTNANAAHLAGLGTVDAVADAKGELYAGLPESGTAVANADDRRMLERAKSSGRRLITFGVGRASPADVVVAEVLAHGPAGLRFLLGVGNREIEVSLHLVGLHNAANAAAAAAAAIALGAGDREIAAGLADVRPVGRRLRLEKLPSGVSLVDDCYNANPASMAAALGTLLELAAASPGARPVAVLGDMLELGPLETEAHRSLGEEAARRGVKLLAAFGPRSRELASAALAAGMPEASVFQTEEMQALLAWARRELRGEDVLLVKGSRGMMLERLVEALH